MPDLVSWLPLDTLLGIVRIGFGLMFLVKLGYSFDAVQLVWAHKRPGGEGLFRALRIILFSSAVFFTLGLFTGPAALVMWLLYVVLWRYASLYGMEDIAFHAIAFYFVFAGAGDAVSLDALFGVIAWSRLPAGTLIPELALAVALGNIFLSAGVTKLPSKMWQRGLGAYYFFLMPNFRRFDTSLITRFELPIRILNYVALVMEIGMLPAILLNGWPVGLLFWFLAFGFTITLATIFVLTWIGEALSLVMLLVLWLLLHQQGAGLLPLLTTELGALSWTPLNITLIALMTTTLGAGLWVSIIAFPKWVEKVPFVRELDRLFRTISRNTWGLIPCIVFTETHMEGPVVYRVWAEDGEGSREVFRIFGEQSNPGPDRPFRPAFYEVTSYKVAEACMELDNWGEVRTEPRRAFILRLAELIARKASHQGTHPESLRFRMRQIIPPKGFAGSIQPHLEKPWRDAFVVRFNQGQAVSIEGLGDKILEGPTGRDINRISFAFNPRQP
ncbi:hypothetical protein KQI63_05050 [bacterium]|nr:hypothetical protein [bacterium]